MKLRRGGSGRGELLILIAALPLLPFIRGGGAPGLQVSAAAGGNSVAWGSGYSLVQHQLPDANSEPWAITTDSHGEVWFVEQGTNMLGDYDPGSGTFRQYSIPTPKSTADSVAVDAEGNVWFAELTANNLGELAAGSNRILEYGIPGAAVKLGGLTQTIGCGPGAVLPDASGNIWVACLFSNQIDEFHSAEGHFEEFNLPVFQSAPAGLLLDGKGSLWFTAADAQMLGRGTLSQMVNGTSDGIAEFAPLNQTYLYTFTHATSYLGSTTTITSSLPTPSGIAMDRYGRLWVTEHVDSSFDSYDPATQSLVKYWTSQTFGAYGLSVSFPNGIAVDKNGTVWVGEHYGNKIALLMPSSGAMVEYPVPCCSSGVAGVYSIALDPSGRPWFVEIAGNAIGELVGTPAPLQLSMTMPQTMISLDSQGSAAIPMSFSEGAGASTPSLLSLSASGVSGTGELQNMTAEFSQPTVSLVPGGKESTVLTLTLAGLDPGVYYITVGAKASQSGVVYSAVLKLVVAPASQGQLVQLIPVAVGVAAAVGAAGWLLARRSRPRARPRRR